MTADEKRSLEELKSLMVAMQKENAAFREQTTKLIVEMNEKVERKHVPISLEGNILSLVQEAMNKAIVDALGGYNSPISKLVNIVVMEHSDELKKIMTSSFEEVIRVDDFKRSIVSAFSHKVARSIISNNNGIYDKVANDLKQDATFKAKMALAVANVVEECLIKKD